MKMKRAGSHDGFTLLDLVMTLAALCVIGFLLWPRHTRCRVKASRINCTNNLKQVGLACRQWAVDNNDKFPAAISTANGGAQEWIEAGAVYTSFLVMSNELNTPKILFCPEESNPKRVVATVFVPFTPTNSSWQGVPFTNNSNISYFVNPDADETLPQRFLSGDDNFLVNGLKPRSGMLLLRTNDLVAWTKDRHVNQGNIGLADGSVMGVSTPLLQKALINTGIATNRLAMP